MTDQTNIPQQPVGVDLARVALRAAREAASRNGTTTEPRAPHRRHRARRGADGREPEGFGAVIEGLMTDHAWTMPVAGGNAVDLWPIIAGDRLAAHIQAVAFRKDRQELVVHADSPAWLTQLRLQKPGLLQRFQDALGPDVVRDIVRTSPGRAPAPATTQAAPAAAPEEPAPVTTPETASPGYRQARDAHLKTRTAPAEKPRSIPPSPTLREPTEHFARELARHSTPRPSADPHTKALARARRERTEQSQET
ncbi:DciA family protein [Streptomyces qinglanensis]|uniref:DciA family protein n=1 Tax=Streptomyces qinglanensis TaxID=943816 RepID=UPI003D752BBF